jgi:hypothetical protein
MKKRMKDGMKIGKKKGKINETKTEAWEGGKEKKV